MLPGSITSRLAAAAMALLAAGCTTYVTVSADAPPTPPLAPMPAPAFAYELPPPPVALTPVADWDSRHHELLRLSFRSIGANGQSDNTVEAHYYANRHGEGPHPLVVVLPLWGASPYPPHAVTTTLLKRGRHELSVVRVLGEDYIFDWDALAGAPDEDAFRDELAAMAARMETTVIDLRRLLDWLTLQPEVDAERIGLVGFSMSAVVGAQLLGADDRLHAAVLLMGGANLEEIIATCNGPLADVRRQVTRRFGWSDAQYEAVVEEAFGALNPTRYPSRTPPDQVLMVDSYYDECMPKSSRDAYWEALGRPRRLSLLFGHRQSFWSLTPIGFSVMRGRVYRAFRETLLELDGVDGDPGPPEPVRAATAGPGPTRSDRATQ